MTEQSAGALSRIGSAEVVAALDLARRGRVYDLGLEINRHIPHNPDFARFSFAFTQTPEGTGAKSPFQFSAEVISGSLHISTHIDAFVHIQAEDRIFGGTPAASARSDGGWTKFGMETVAPIIGRGIVLDMTKLTGSTRLPDSYDISVRELQDALAMASLSIQAGDIVMVRTGKIQDFGDEVAFQGPEPGVGPEAALWLHDQGMAVLGTDTTGTEPLPFKDPAHTTHRAMLVDRGVHLIENLNLEEVAGDGVTQGLFICLPLKITGATGSWVRPVLVV